MFLALKSCVVYKGQRCTEKTSWTSIQISSIVAKNHSAVHTKMQHATLIFQKVKPLDQTFCNWSSSHANQNFL